MIPLAVTGRGVVSPVGTGIEAFYAALQQGTTAWHTPDGGAPVARVGDFGAKQHIAAGSLRRMPRVSQMTIVAAKEALGTVQSAYDATRIGAVIGTGLGTLHETIAFINGYVDGGVAQASPLLFPYSVMNTAAGQLAIECGLRGVNSTVNHRDASGLGALTMAADALRLGRADAVVVGTVDEASSAAQAGYAALGGLTKSALRPYDRERDGLALGEGAAMLLLERLDDAQKRGATIFALLPGDVAAGGESRARVGWHGSFAGAVSTVKNAVAAGGVSIDYVAGAGNGSALDEAELSVLARALAGQEPLVSSILGQIGESLASSGFRLLTALYALERQTLPGTVGLRAPLPSPLLIDGPGRAGPMPVRGVLVASLAQGGANHAVVLARS